MHERSLVKTLLEQVDQIQREHGAIAVGEICVEVGPLSGVDITLMQIAFEQLASRSALGAAALVVNQVPLVGHCSSCVLEQRIDKFDFRCEHCGGNLAVIRGDSVQLVSVNLETEEPMEASSS